MRRRTAPRHVERDARRRWRIATAVDGHDTLAATVDYLRARLADEDQQRADALARLAGEHLLAWADQHLGAPR